MNNVRTLHNEAMNYADKGDNFRRVGQIADAIAMFTLALEKEQSAASLATRQLSKTILRKSAEALEREIASLTKMLRKAQS